MEKGAAMNRPPNHRPALDSAIESGGNVGGHWRGVRLAILDGYYWEVAWAPMCSFDQNDAIVFKE
jgi:hypothetical protein